jgi:hypothetical protein
VGGDFRQMSETKVFADFFQLGYGRLGFFF